MKKIRTYFIIILCIVLTSCAAQMVSSPGAASTSLYAPVNEASRGGVVKYLNAGADFVIKERREDAYKQMYDACKGKYRINAEGQNAEGGYVVATGNVAAWGQAQYWYIQFSCVQ